jgi:C1A family cysteine protease
MSRQKPLIDAHCHLFNVFFLTSEIAEILWDSLWGNYPHRKEAFAARAGAGVSLASIRSWLDDLLTQIRQVAHSSFNSYEENFNLLTAAYRRSFKTDEPLIVYPLMMDIHYMVAEPCTAPPQAAPSKQEAAEPPIEDPRAAFDALFAEVRAAVIQRHEETMPERVMAFRAAAAAPPEIDVERTLEKIYDRIVQPPPPTGFKAADTTGLELSKGFEKQVWELLELHKRHPECVFPFFAVDPRRSGVMEMLTRGRPFLPTAGPLVSPKGPFFGLKLYPRLGYLPQDVDRLCPELFGWCAESGIPITAHCSRGGFPPIRIYNCDDFGDPAHWEPILDKYRGLKLDLAHFGNEGPGWAQKIVALMKKPGSRLYTDLACCTDPARLRDARDLIEAEPVLGERLMFGTDFDVMLMTDLITLENYFRQFDPEAGQIFTDEQFAAMAGSVPRAFLGRETPAAAGEKRGATGAEAGPFPAARRLDRRARSAFLKLIAGKNRFGWVRDLPDIRDYSAEQGTLCERLVRNGATATVSDMVTPTLKKVKARVLPAAVDLTPWCSPVEDQGPIGACTAHAAVALVEYFQTRTEKKHIDSSRLFVYKVSRNLLNWQGDTGAYLRTAMEALVLFGVPPERYMPYVPENFDSEPSAFCYAFGQSFQTASYYRLDPLGTPAVKLLQDIKTSLAAGYPLMFGFTVYDSAGEADENQGRVPFPSPQDRVVGGHAVAAVGYDDGIVICNSEPGSLPTRGAIRIRNSWGTAWGEEGYGWLPYDFVLKGLAVDWWTIIKQEWVDLEPFQ